MKRIDRSRKWMVVLAVSGAMLIGTVSAAGAGRGCRGPEALRGGKVDGPGIRQELRQDLRELRRDRLELRRNLREIRRDRQELRRHLRELRQDRRGLRHDMIRMRGLQRSHRC